MKKNMGRNDKLIRVGVAAIIAILYLNNVITGTLGFILLGMAGVFLLTSLVGFCPLYTVFGFSSCKTKS